MAKLKSLNIADNTPATLNRMYQNVGEALAAIPETAKTTPVQVVRFTNAIKTYNVIPSDVYIIVNALGGPGSIVLPVPNRATQAVSIKKGPDTANAVTIIQANGKPFGSGVTSIGIGNGVDITMVNDGATWWDYGG